MEMVLIVSCDRTDFQTPLRGVDVQDLSLIEAASTLTSHSFTLWDGV